MPYVKTPQYMGDATISSAPLTPEQKAKKAEGLLARASEPVTVTPSDGKTPAFVTTRGVIEGAGRRKQRKTKRRSSTKTKKTRGRRRH